MQSQIVQDVPNMFWILFYVSLLFMCYIMVFFFFLIFFYLAAPGLSCGTRDLHVDACCSMWDLIP